MNPLVEENKMPQSVFIQVGQCGNQVGFRFWESAIKEYNVYSDRLDEDYFCHFLKPSSKDVNMSGKSLEECYDARAVLIDMEEGVIAEGCRGPLRKLFNQNQILTDVSGSGNNWAVGNKIYGRKYLDSMINLFRKEAEHCDNLDSFLLLFSMGGGTGSGLGTAALECLHDEFPKVPRLVFAVFPSAIDDVITSPYNAILANSKLVEHAKCVIPFENQVLNDICMKMDKNKRRIRTAAGTRTKIFSDSRFADVSSKKNICKPFDDMNELISNTILDFTSSSRFPGSLNVDMSDIMINMMPFPYLHYLVSSTAPFMFAPEGSKIDQVFGDLFSESHQLFDCPVKKGVLLAAALLCRGDVSLTDLQNNINRLGQSMKFVPWNEDGWKLGLCDYPPAGRLCSLLMLANTSGIAHKFEAMKGKFFKMYQKKAHMHHFLDVDSDIMETFKTSINNLTKLITEYKNIDSLLPDPELTRPSVI